MLAMLRPDKETHRKNRKEEQERKRDRGRQTVGGAQVTRIQKGAERQRERERETQVACMCS